jgi:hypothetical protein
LILTIGPGPLFWLQSGAFDTVGGPAPSAFGPLLSGLDGPLPSGLDGPLPSGLDGPLPSGLDGPLPSGLNGPLPSGLNGPLPSGLNGPLLLGLNGPLPLGLNGLNSHGQVSSHPKDFSYVYGSMSCLSSIYINLIEW